MSKPTDREPTAEPVRHTAMRCLGLDVATSRADLCPHARENYDAVVVLVEQRNDLQAALGEANRRADELHERIKLSREFFLEWFAIMAREHPRDAERHAIIKDRLEKALSDEGPSELKAENARLVALLHEAVNHILCVFKQKEGKVKLATCWEAGYRGTENTADPCGHCQMRATIREAIAAHEGNASPSIKTEGVRPTPEQAQALEKLQTGEINDKTEDGE